MSQPEMTARKSKPNVNVNVKHGKDLCHCDAEDVFKFVREVFAIIQQTKMLR